MKALIAPNEKVYLPDGSLGSRVAWVCAEEYPSAAPHFWVDCADNVIPDQFYYDGTQILPVPQPAPTE